MCSVAGALSFGTILWTAPVCSRTFCLLKGLVPFVPIVLLLREKKNEEREESWDPSMGECLYLYKAVTEEEIFFFQITLKWSPLLALSSKCIWTFSDGSDKEPKCGGSQNHGVSPSAALLARLCCHLLCGGDERLGSAAFLAWRA